MTRINLSLSVVLLIGISPISAYLALAQEPTSSAPPRQIVQPVKPTRTASPPRIHPDWTYQRQTQNQPGTVGNTHRYTDSPDGGQYIIQHVVDNPRGEMTQTRQRTNTGDGYQYQRTQTFVGPDGTLLRQHERSVTGTDRQNYTREHTKTLRDGRMIGQTQTRAWDGTTGTMERAFVGPNGQTRSGQRTFAATNQPGQPSRLVTSPATPPAVRPTGALSKTEPAKKERWWRKLNPFRKRGSDSTRSTAASAPRRGFTVGTPTANTSRANTANTSSLRAGEQALTHASQNTHRPSWAGGAPRSVRTTKGSASLRGGATTASRPNPGRGHNR
jgi:hypothetical protein